MCTHAFLEIGNEMVEFWVKHFEEGSDYGINGGRISKLTVKHKDETLLNYDRDWDIKPATELGKKALKKMLEKFN